MKLGCNYHQLKENPLTVSIFKQSRDPLLGNWFYEGRYEKIDLFSFFSFFHDKTCNHQCF